MINVEFNTKNNQQIIITLDDCGIEALVQELEHLRGKIDHFHLFSPSWTSEIGAELSEQFLSGDEFHWCHELSIGTVAPAIENNIQVFVDATISKKQYSALQVAIIRTQQEIQELLSCLKEIRLTKNTFSLEVNAQYTIKQKFHLTQKQALKLELIFLYPSPSLTDLEGTLQN